MLGRSSDSGLARGRIGRAVVRRARRMLVQSRGASRGATESDFASAVLSPRSGLGRRPPNRNAYACGDALIVLLASGLLLPGSPVLWDGAWPECHRPRASTGYGRGVGRVEATAAVAGGHAPPRRGVLRGAAWAAMSRAGAAAVPRRESRAPPRPTAPRNHRRPSSCPPPFLPHCGERSFMASLYPAAAFPVVPVGQSGFDRSTKSAGQTRERPSGPGCTSRRSELLDG